MTKKRYNLLLGILLAFLILITVSFKYFTGTMFINDKFTRRTVNAYRLEQLRNGINREFISSNYDTAAVKSHLLGELRKSSHPVSKKIISDFEKLPADSALLLLMLDVVQNASHYNIKATDDGKFIFFYPETVSEGEGEDPGKALQLILQEKEPEVFTVIQLSNIRNFYSIDSEE